MGCSSSTASDLDEKVEFLSLSPFFLHLSESQLRDFAKQFRITQFSAGRTIFDQGEAGAEFYVMGSGECDLTSIEEDKNPQTGEIETKQVFLCSKKKGDIFGEQCLLNVGSTRSATVTATEDCVLLLLTRDSFQAYMQTIPAELQTRICSIMGTKMLDSLREIEFLKGVDDFRLGLLANVFRYVTVQAGETIFEEGDRGRDLFIISEGSVSVSARTGNPSEMKPNTRASFIAGSPVPSPTSKSASDKDTSFGTASTDAAAAAPSPAVPISSSNSNGGDVTFATLSSGQYFGEVSLMVDMPRTATVRALTRCLLLVLNVADFHNFVAVVPGLAEKFTHVASARIAQQFRKFNVPFFQNIPEHRFKALSDLCQLISFEKDEVVFREFDVPRPNAAAFYLVVSGRLNAIKNDIGIVATLSPPSFFGEVALVTDMPRTATIVADTPCVLLSLTKENFAEFFVDDVDGVEQYAEFSIKLSQKQVPLKPVLQHQLGHKLFSQHLASEFSTENILFYDRAGEFEALRFDQQAQQLHECEEIINKYISADAETQINIPAGIREDVIEEFKSGQIASTMFVPARNEIFKLMASDPFKRFKASALFLQLLESVGSYSDSGKPALAHTSSHRMSSANLFGIPAGLQPIDPSSIEIDLSELQLQKPIMRAASIVVQSSPTPTP